MPGVGALHGESPHGGLEGRQRLTRSYRVLFAISIFLAALGAPLLMQGTVMFASALAAGAASDIGALARGAGLLALSASPLVLASYTWRRTQSIQDLLDESD